MAYGVGDEFGEQEQRVVGVRVVEPLQQVADVAAGLGDGGDLRGQIDLAEQSQRPHRASSASRSAASRILPRRRGS
ncbi:hypothetical protein AB0F88_42335 [Streptosporangium sp. NPDC023963]|uniref:hypothetical protein n=1 Tax=Streptosporangium sp. NPDC023963 TaxID=3155608 RepID=UPI0034294BBF